MCLLTMGPVSPALGIARVVLPRGRMEGSPCPHCCTSAATKAAALTLLTEQLLAAAPSQGFFTPMTSHSFRFPKLQPAASTEEADIGHRRPPMAQMVRGLLT